jgi:hypothetical protein
MTTKISMVPVSEANPLVLVDETVKGKPVILAGAIGELMQNVKASLGNMQPDDVSIEVDAQSDNSQSTARVRFRAYRREPKRD